MKRPWNWEVTFPAFASVAGAVQRNGEANASPFAREQGRADEEALLVALQLEVAAIDYQLGAFLDAQLDVVGDLAAVRGGDADPQCLDLGQHLLAEGLGGLGADRHHHRQSHAALAGRAKGGAENVLHRLVEVGVG